MSKKLLFAIAFVIIGLVFLQIPVNVLEGARVKFTLFDLFAPIAGVFLGVPLAVASVIGMQAANLGFHGFSGVNSASPLTLVATLRFLPMIAGVWFFAKKEGKLLVIPALAIIAFNLHPIGRSVWFYSLFWTIPFIVWPLRERFLIARSLGATFTAHAVGGAVWIWAFNLPANIWVSLIPVVIMERAIFAIGISASYIFFNNFFAVLAKRRILTVAFSLDKKYILRQFK